jgi:hypothetical protein
MHPSLTARWMSGVIPSQEITVNSNTSKLEALGPNRSYETQRRLGGRVYLATSPNSLITRLYSDTQHLEPSAIPGLGQSGMLCFILLGCLSHEVGQVSSLLASWYNLLHG